MTKYTSIEHIKVIAFKKILSALYKHSTDDFDTLGNLIDNYLSGLPVDFTKYKIEVNDEDVRSLLVAHLLQQYENLGIIFDEVSIKNLIKALSKERCPTGCQEPKNFASLSMLAAVYYAKLSFCVEYNRENINELNDNDHLFLKQNCKDFSFITHDSKQSNYIGQGINIGTANDFDVVYKKVALPSNPKRMRVFANDYGAKFIQLFKPIIDAEKEEFDDNDPWTSLFNCYLPRFSNIQIERNSYTQFPPSVILGNNETGFEIEFSKVKKSQEAVAISKALLSASPIALTEFADYVERNNEMFKGKRLLMHPGRRNWNTNYYITSAYEEGNLYWMNENDFFHYISANSKALSVFANIDLSVKFFHPITNEFILKLLHWIEYHPGFKSITITPFGEHRYQSDEESWKIIESFIIEKRITTYIRIVASRFNPPNTKEKDLYTKFNDDVYQLRLDALVKKNIEKAKGSINVEEQETLISTVSIAEVRPNVPNIEPNSEPNDPAYWLMPRKINLKNLSTTKTKSHFKEHKINQDSSIQVSTNKHTTLQHAIDNDITLSSTHSSVNEHHLIHKGNYKKALEKNLAFTDYEFSSFDSTHDQIWERLVGGYVYFTHVTPIAMSKVIAYEEVFANGVPPLPIGFIIRKGLDALGQERDILDFDPKSKLNLASPFQVQLMERCAYKPRNVGHNYFAGWERLIDAFKNHHDYDDLYDKFNYILHLQHRQQDSGEKLLDKLISAWEVVLEKVYPHKKVEFLDMLKKYTVDYLVVQPIKKSKVILRIIDKLDSLRDVLAHENGVDECYCLLLHFQLIQNAGLWENFKLCYLYNLKNFLHLSNKDTYELIRKLCELSPREKTWWINLSKQIVNDRKVAADFNENAKAFLELCKQVKDLNAELPSASNLTNVKFLPIALERLVTILNSAAYPQDILNHTLSLDADGAYYAAMKHKFKFICDEMKLQGPTSENPDAFIGYKVSFDDLTKSDKDHLITNFYRYWATQKKILPLKDYREFIAIVSLLSSREGNDVSVVIAHMAKYLTKFSHWELQDWQDLTGLINILSINHNDQQIKILTDLTNHLENHKTTRFHELLIIFNYALTEENEFVNFLNVITQNISDHSVELLYTIATNEKRLPLATYLLLANDDAIAPYLSIFAHFDLSDYDESGLKTLLKKTSIVIESFNNEFPNFSETLFQLFHKASLTDSLDISLITMIVDELKLSIRDVNEENIKMVIIKHCPDITFKETHRKTLSEKNDKSIVDMISGDKKFKQQFDKLNALVNYGYQYKITNNLLFFNNFINDFLNFCKNPENVIPLEAGIHKELANFINTTKKVMRDALNANLLAKLRKCESIIPSSAMHSLHNYLVIQLKDYAIDFASPTEYISYFYILKNFSTQLATVFLQSSWSKEKLQKFSKQLILALKTSEREKGRFLFLMFEKILSEKNLECDEKVTIINYLLQSNQNKPSQHAQSLKILSNKIKLFLHQPNVSLIRQSFFTCLMHSGFDLEAFYAVFEAIKGDEKVVKNLNNLIVTFKDKPDEINKILDKFNKCDSAKRVLIMAIAATALKRCPSYKLITVFNETLDSIKEMDVDELREISENIKRCQTDINVIISLMKSHDEESLNVHLDSHPFGDRNFERELENSPYAELMIRQRIASICYLTEDKEQTHIPISEADQDRLFQQLQRIAIIGESLTGKTNLELQNLLPSLALALSNEESRDEDVQLRTLALFRELYYRHAEKPLFLNSSQMLALLCSTLNSNKSLKNIATGQGKGAIAAVEAAYRVYCGKMVDYISYNHSLVKRDFTESQKFFKALSIPTVMIEEDSEPNHYLKMKDDGSVIKTGINFSEMSVLALFRLRHRNTHEHIEPNATSRFAVIDEAHHPHIHQTTSFICSVSPEDENLYVNPYAELYRCINQYTEYLTLKKLQDNGIKLDSTESKQLDLLLKMFGDKPTPKNISEEVKLLEAHLLSNREILTTRMPSRRRLNQLIKSSYLARGLTKEEDFIIKTVPVTINGETKNYSHAVILNENGVPLPQSRWTNGVHQLLHNRLSIQYQNEIQSGDMPEFILEKEHKPNAITTANNIIGFYNNSLSNYTATPGGLKFLNHYNGCEVIKFPLHQKSRRIIHPPEYPTTKDSYYDNIAHRIKECGTNSTLIVCDSIEEVESLNAALSKRLPNAPIQILTGKNSDKTDIVLNNAGQPNYITISTLMDLGQDIKISYEYRELLDASRYYRNVCETWLQAIENDKWAIVKAEEAEAKTALIKQLDLLTGKASSENIQQSNPKLHAKLCKIRTNLKLKCKTKKDITRHLALMAEVITQIEPKLNVIYTIVAEPNAVLQAAGRTGRQEQAGEFFPIIDPDVVKQHGYEAKELDTIQKRNEFVLNVQHAKQTSIKALKAFNNLYGSYTAQLQKKYDNILLFLNKKAMSQPIDNENSVIKDLIDKVEFLKQEHLAEFNLIWDETQEEYNFDDYHHYRIWLSDIKTSVDNSLKVEQGKLMSELEKLKWPENIRDDIESILQPIDINIVPLQAPQKFFKTDLKGNYMRFFTQEDYFAKFNAYIMRCLKGDKSSLQFMANTLEQQPHASDEIKPAFIKFAEQRLKKYLSGFWIGDDRKAIVSSLIKGPYSLEILNNAIQTSINNDTEPSRKFRKLTHSRLRDELFQLKKNYYMVASLYDVKNQLSQERKLLIALMDVPTKNDSANTIIEQVKNELDSNQDFISQLPVIVHSLRKLTATGISSSDSRHFQQLADYYEWLYFATSATCKADTAKQIQQPQATIIKDKLMHKIQGRLNYLTPHPFTRLWKNVPAFTSERFAEVVTDQVIEAAKVTMNKRDKNQLVRIISLVSAELLKYYPKGDIKFTLSKDYSSKTAFALEVTCGRLNAESATFNFSINLDLKAQSYLLVDRIPEPKHALNR